MKLWQFLAWIDTFLENLFPRPNYDKPVTSLPMNQTTPSMSISQPVETSPKYLWDTPENARHSLRVICDEEGLTVQQKDDFSKTIHCESDYDNTIVMLNCEHGFVRSTKYDVAIHGVILSKDVGMFQINTHWHVGPGKDFPSEDYILQNPEACARWSARIFKQSPNTWVCHSKGMYENYSA